MDVHRTSKSGKILTAEQRFRFHEDGVVFPIRAFSADEADDYRRECDRLEALLGGRPRTVEVRQMHLHFPWAYRLATQPRLLDAVEDLLGPDLLIWATELFAKHPDDRVVSIGWHRDGAYMGLEPEHTLTAWVALSPSRAANGCMRVVHEADRRVSGSVQRTTGKPEDSIMDVELQAGELSLHDVYVLHGSGPNLGRDKRVGFAIRFTTPQARPTTSTKVAAKLVRGEDRYGFFDLQPPPLDGDPVKATDGMRRSARQHLEATLQNLKHAAR
jgi:non-haem Fe2+, alpha-ketoglutarate-dependent halogenase